MSEIMKIDFLQDYFRLKEKYNIESKLAEKIEVGQQYEFYFINGEIHNIEVEEITEEGTGKYLITGITNHDRDIWVDLSKTEFWVEL